VQLQCGGGSEKMSKTVLYILDRSILKPYNAPTERIITEHNILCKATLALFRLQVFSLSLHHIKSLDTCMEY